MAWLIWLGIGVGIGFIGGVLVYRNNVKKLEAALKEAEWLVGKKEDVGK